MAKEEVGSAERELLKAIENESEQQPEMGSDQSDPVGKSGIPGMLSGNSAGAFAITLHDTRKILAGFVFFLMIWLAISIVKGAVNLSIVPDFREAQKNISTEGPEVEEIPVKGFGYYSDVVLSRNIFKPGSIEEIEEKKVPAVKNLAKNLKIAGFADVPGTNEKYALVEDKKTGITYFLKKGDSVSVLKVKDILDSKVILTHMSEEIVLK